MFSHFFCLYTLNIERSHTCYLRYFLLFILFCCFCCYSLFASIYEWAPSSQRLGIHRCSCARFDTAYGVLLHFSSIRSIAYILTIRVCVMYTCASFHIGYIYADGWPCANAHRPWKCPHIHPSGSSSATCTYNLCVCVSVRCFLALVLTSHHVRVCTFLFDGYVLS